MKANQQAPVLHIGIPNPMFEGELNMYVIAGDPLTLVDTGIGTPEALAAKFPQLRGAGFMRAGGRLVLVDLNESLVIGVLDR